MHKLNHMSSLLLYLSFLFYLLFSSSSLNVAATDAANPFTPKASLIRYWKIQISNDLPKPWFLLNKASPLTAVESATFSKLANDQNALANQLQSFCSSADLLCFPDLSPSLETQDDKFINWADPEVKPKAFKVAGPAVQIGYGKSFNEGNGMMVDGKAVNKWVEPGLFFRERMLKMGTIMPMPDIKDKLPKRSFLPRVISSKLPFSKISEMKRIFHAKENSSMASMLAAAVSECERAPNAGETKRCVGSLEDMIDFSISVLGHNVVVRTTENMEGSKKDVMIGKVNGINGGKVTKSVSCHQSLFPYLLYYCHSVLKVRVYEADILDPKTKAKINHGVAICHVDTSSWSAGHVAFMALGSGPGKIEVCHWIFENDMTWATAD
ncbi:polygalacturonase-1 non-catalytic subunit beta-like isoform X3 [Rhododendron vialii]|uniref:polygalacturonase-1 non-catalytic subunit beta-like isoform X3 n=1 Tax=Rhododendron vialii TaxID=182163 RepID=UPI00265EA52C|nr:polygalacturonase-1 non-catalytic subunit beta-like isoform X3 [Rhododendron vialii]